MQEVYYELKDGRLEEVVSDEDTCGRKLPGIFFKKTFDSLWPRIQFENAAGAYIARCGDRFGKEENLTKEFLWNCTQTPDIFGIKEK